MRISNANEQCELVKESRLCNLRPCEVDITKHIKVLVLSNVLLWNVKRGLHDGKVIERLPTPFVPSARKEMSEHLQGRSALQPHHLWLHQQEAVQAQVLWRLHRRSLLHPVQVQDRRCGLWVSQRDRIHLEDVVDPGLFLQPQLQKPQRHLRRAGELLWLPRSHELKRQHVS